MACQFACHCQRASQDGFGRGKETDMALRDIFRPAALARTSQAPAKADQAHEHQVDYSYTQWRYAQMLQLERNYCAACASVEGGAAA